MGTTFRNETLAVEGDTNDPYLGEALTNGSSYKFEAWIEVRGRLGPSYVPQVHSPTNNLHLISHVEHFQSEAQITIVHIVGTVEALSTGTYISVYYPIGCTVINPRYLEVTALTTTTSANPAGTTGLGRGIRQPNPGDSPGGDTPRVQAGLHPTTKFAVLSYTKFAVL